MGQASLSQNHSNWYLYVIDYNPDQLTSISRNNVTIALIDSGINTNNSHIWTNPNEKLNKIDDDNNGYIDDIHGWNFVNNTNNVTDTSGHGTLMASIITKLNSKVNIMALKVLNKYDKLESLNLLTQALKYAIKEQVNIIVIAIYFNTLNPTIDSLISQARVQNIGIITDSGNYGACSCNNGMTNALANLKGVLTIGAINQEYNRASYSQYGPSLDLMAPGTITENNITYTGTSVATGFGAGVYSILDGIRTNATLITTILERAATDLNVKNKDIYTGYGLLNVSLALETIIDRVPPTAKLVSTGKAIKITDNVGIYKVSSPNNTIVIQGQNRTIILTKLAKNYNISVEDLAGNSIIFTVQQSNKQTTGFEMGYFIESIFSLIIITKRKKISKN